MTASNNTLVDLKIKYFGQNLEVCYNTFSEKILSAKSKGFDLIDTYSKDQISELLERVKEHLSK